MTATKSFSNLAYTRCARTLTRDLAAEFSLILDPEMPTDRIRYVGPVYGGRDVRYTCVPTDATIGERLIAADVWDSVTRMQVYEIVALDEVIGKERAPHLPAADVRRAIVVLVHTARSHMQRITDHCEEGERAYCFGHDWFDEGKAPYPVFRVDTGEEVRPE